MYLSALPKFDLPQMSAPSNIISLVPVGLDDEPGRKKAARSAEHFVGGLEWTPVPDPKQLAGAMREAAATREVIRAATVESKQFGQIAAHGFWIGSGLEEDIKVPRNAHSLAAVVADLVTAAGMEQALLVLSHPNGTHSCVVRVSRGIPLLDAVRPADVAIRMAREQIAAAPGIPILTNDPSNFPESFSISWDKISEGASKRSRLKGVPVNLVGLTVVVLLAAGLLGGWLAFDRYRKAEERAELLRQQAELDPTPKYLAALAAQRGAVGFSPLEAARVVEDIQRLPVHVDGWSIESIACDVSSGCTAVWKRTYGTFSTWRAGRPSDEVDPPLPPGEGGGAADLQLDRLVAKWRQPGQPGELPESLPTLDDYLWQSGPTLQIWKTALLGLSSLPAPVLWPQIPDVPPSFKHPQAVYRGALAIDGVNPGLVENLIRSTPAGIVWTRIGLSLGSDPSYSLEGNFYVR